MAYCGIYRHTMADTIVKQKKNRLDRASPKKEPTVRYDIWVKVLEDIQSLTNKADELSSTEVYKLKVLTDVFYKIKDDVRRDIRDAKVKLDDTTDIGAIFGQTDNSQTQG